MAFQVLSVVKDWARKIQIFFVEIMKGFHFKTYFSITTICFMYRG